MYTWNFDEDAEIWNNDTHETVEGCISEAKEDNKLDGCGHDDVYIGECDSFVPSVDVESMLDNLQEQAYEECGECGYDWEAYDNKKSSELEELQEAVDSIVHDWLKKYGYYPSFYRIQNIKRYSLKDEVAPKED